MFACYTIYVTTELSAVTTCYTDCFRQQLVLARFTHLTNSSSLNTLFGKKNVNYDLKMMTFKIGFKRGIVWFQPFQ